MDCFGRCLLLFARCLQQLDYAAAFEKGENRARLVDAQVDVGLDQVHSLEAATAVGETEAKEAEGGKPRGGPAPVTEDTEDIVYSAVMVVVPPSLAQQVALAAGATGVVFVDTVSPQLYEAGLRQGDQVVKINGSYASAENLDDVEHRLKQ